MKTQRTTLDLSYAGFALAFTLLITLSGATIWSHLQTEEDFNWVVHTGDVLISSGLLLSTLQDAETGQRGYLLTGREAYLEPYQAAANRIEETLLKLRTLTSDNSRQLKKIDDLQILIYEKLDELQGTIAMRREQGFDAALQIVLTNRGKRTMDEIRWIVAELEAEENGLLRVRQANVESATRMTSVMTLAATALILLLCLVAVWRVKVEDARWKEAEEQRSQLALRLRQSQKMEALGTLAGGIAHGFDNLLQAIMGSTELLALKLSDDEGPQADLERLSEATLRAKELVNNILSFTSQSETERRPLWIASEVKHGLALVRASLPSTVEIREDIDPAAGVVFGDPARIQQVVVNLCTNAYQAMDERDGVVILSLRAVELDAEFVRGLSGLQAGRYIRLTVRDSGCGMDQATQARIFEPFFTTRPVGKGTGMGLSEVHGTVTEYGGTISVRSAPGEGAVVDVYLPSYTGAVSTEWATQSA